MEELVSPSLPEVLELFLARALALLYLIIQAYVVSSEFLLPLLQHLRVC